MYQEKVMWMLKIGLFDRPQQNVRQLVGGYWRAKVNGVVLMFMTMSVRHVTNLVNESFDQSGKK